MAEVVHRFDNSEAYERFMGRWSRAAGEIFLGWLKPSVHLDWLDVGCGTGVFTELVRERCEPACLVGVDSSPAQVAHGKQRGSGIDYRVGDAQALPFPDASFDATVAALAINFVPNRIMGVQEMRRVVRRGGIVAGYVWDFSAERSPSWPLRAGLRQIEATVPQVPGAEDSTAAGLGRLLEQADLSSVETCSFDVAVSFDSFDAFWDTQMPPSSPVVQMVSALSQDDRSRLRDLVHNLVMAAPGASVRYVARANAVRARRHG